MPEAIPNAQDPAPVAENQKDPTPPHARKHFKTHVKAIAESTAKIGDGLAALRKLGGGDKQIQIMDTMHTNVAQLHLALNNAMAVPDEDQDENLGGAAHVAVDPNRPDA